MPNVTKITTERKFKIIRYKLYVWNCVLRGSVEETVMVIVIEAAMWHCTVPLEGSLHWLCLPAMWHCTVPLEGSLHWLCLPAMWHCTVPLDGSLYWLCLPAMWHCTVPLDGSLYWLCLPLCCIVLCHWNLAFTGSALTASVSPIFHTTKCLSLHS